jgi:hypothetical protein
VRRRKKLAKYLWQISSSGKKNEMADDCAGASLPLRFDAPPFLTPAAYAAASERAHTVLGFALACIVCVWGALVVRPSPRVTAARCYAAAGATSLAAGAYLLAWVYALSFPGGGARLRAFAGRDLVQRQHASMACLFGVAGLAECLHARALSGSAGQRRLLARDWVHSVWFHAVAACGFIFVAHPQHSAASVGAHVAVGCGLVLGAFHLANEKRGGFRADALDAPAAGCCVAVAAVVLVAYREPAGAGAVHRGIEARCLSGAVLATLGRWYAALALAILAAAAAYDARPDVRHARAPGYELAPRDEDMWPKPRDVS